ncbi:hypothetical protein [Halalkalicoccus tibetensis]|uniref:Uncharacterized protein n=1 Tax=Halalkalicoccus tibetensis TaxID=175632 RepID=A0ABD5UY41_9EURY
MLEADPGVEPGMLSPIVPVVTTLLIALFAIGILYRIVGLAF